ncbi:acetyl-CoA C-acyltransferase FadA [Psychrosphaera algicola]|uniref:acetyl-CoA C-acyltransferase n=1 Tax=Psychrosphaera algicola TaxID=3023714 RepID=A0ABT5FE75_9GAMM|nr:acetyl-CoA C-acyltransferase FadA [Psychrosphaera sp. G1-22]MDC2889860.1 acetyl-CoA C-acyltransferase FadA [Psychrosphaera sp. G1-22]
MNNVVIVDCVRTPMAKARNGMFDNVRAEDLSAAVMTALLKRNPSVNAEELDDVIWGCVMQTLEQGFNIARQAALLAGIPTSVPAVTVNRLCGSSMQALHDAACKIMAGQGDMFIIGGVEHMTHVPMTHGLDFHPGLNLTTAQAAGSMGLTAEALARKHDISRQQQDEFGVRSHQLAHQASLNGHFDNEIIPVEGHDALGALTLCDYDEVIRPETNIESVSGLRPVFNPVNGTVTAATSSALSNGASGMLVMSEEKANELGLKIRAKVIGMGVSGCEPSTMGWGPVPATKIALKHAGLSIEDVDVFELNEAFAAQALSVMKGLGIENKMEQVNLNGGAIALGHPLGCSGSRISTTLINNLERTKGKVGLATMCIGFGQGIATLFETV